MHLAQGTENYLGSLLAFSFYSLMQSLIRSLYQYLLSACLPSRVRAESRASKGLEVTQLLMFVVKTLAAQRKHRC